MTNIACIQASLVRYNLIPIFFTLNRSSKWAFAITLVTYSSNMCTTNNFYFIEIRLPKDNIEIQCVLTFHKILKAFLSQPHFGAKCENVTHTPESGKMESFGTPENSELEFKGQTTSNWSVLYINGKVLKCRCPKWPRMCHLDIYSPSYGQKKGRESNC